MTIEILCEGDIVLSTLSFKSFCIELYSQHIGKPSNEIYGIFLKEGLLELLDSDYEDLHGMGIILSFLEV
jgi:hypothetical protein